VDEDIRPSDLLRLADDLDARLLHYREVGIWQYGDYFHAVLGRTRGMPRVAAREFRPTGLARIKFQVKRVLGRVVPTPEGVSGYLGPDVLAAPQHDVRVKFEVSDAERAGIATAWKRGRG
jgi:hypothetical protein